MSTSRTLYALFSYNSSCNLGDEVQSLAAEQYLPRVDCLIDRDTGTVTYLNGLKQEENDEIKIIMNGWFDGQYTKFQFPSNLNAKVISFHLNETNHSKDTMYNYLEEDNKEQKKNYTSITEYKDFFLKNGPVGCRDRHTLKKFTDAGIKAYYSACLTLTLPPNWGRKSGIIVMDAHINCKKLFEYLFPESVRNQAIYLTQTTDIKYSHDTKIALARQHHLIIRECAILITNRIHSAYPGLASRTKVYFITEDPDDVRFTGIDKLLPIYTWKSPPIIEISSIYEQPPLLKPYIAGIQREIRNWLFGGISIFTACMNRSSNLEKALPTWIAAHPNEIVIVDWGSKESIKPLIDKYRNNDRGVKIKLIRVTNVKKWVLTWAFNLAAKYTSCGRILKADCDTILKEDFFVKHSLEGNVFYAGDWRKARTKNENYVNGVIYTKREDFFKSKGYHEGITTYGWDDCGLYDEESKINTRKCFDLDLIGHIEHDDEQRTSNQNLLYPDRLDVEIERNRLLNEAIPWTGEFSDYENVLIDEDYTEVKHVKANMMISEEKREEFMAKALANKRWIGLQKKKIYLEVNGDIENRMKVIASGHSIAQGCGKYLVVIWKTEENICELKYNEIYKVHPGFDVQYSEIRKEDKIVYDCTKEKDLLIDEKEKDKDIYIISGNILNNSYSNEERDNVLLGQLQRF